MPDLPVTHKGQQTRDHILASAYTLFLQQGYNATSMRDIVRQSGITMGGIYAHFQNKEEIFTAVLEKDNPFTAMLPVMQSAAGDTLEEFVHDLAAHMLNALGQQRQALNLIFIEIVEFNGVHFNNITSSNLPLAMGIVTRFYELAPDLRPIPLPVLARSFIGLFFSYFMTAILVKDHFTVDPESLVQFVDIYLHGILSDHKTPSR
jgi:TetR/AcrR family acrAB operon transcriptional repressor